MLYSSIERLKGLRKFLTSDSPKGNLKSLETNSSNFDGNFESIRKS
jgi:hypothetical protein